VRGGDVALTQAAVNSPDDGDEIRHLKTS
jgi:hypothetical protein